MAVWGIGAYYIGTVPADKTQEFINNNCACIGWGEDKAPALHQMLKSIKNGDIVYIKSFYKYRELFIKAVGIVTDNTIIDTDFGKGVTVKWKETSLEPIIIDANTIYEEYDKEIINKLVSAIIG